jgi:hypothetical protein
VYLLFDYPEIYFLFTYNIQNILFVYLWRRRWRLTAVAAVAAATAAAWQQGGGDRYRCGNSAAAAIARRRR